MLRVKKRKKARESVVIREIFKYFFLANIWEYTNTEMQRYCESFPVVNQFRKTSSRFNANNCLLFQKYFGKHFKVPLDIRLKFIPYERKREIVWCKSQQKKNVCYSQNNLFRHKFSISSKRASERAITHRLKHSKQTCKI